jgi:hypothetical protein
MLTAGHVWSGSVFGAGQLADGIICGSDAVECALAEP